jgi:hypothetical protein
MTFLHVPLEVCFELEDFTTPFYALPNSPVRFEFMRKPVLTRIIESVGDGTLFVSTAIWV